jgi:histidinol-phosphatase (PHP family)
VKEAYYRLIQQSAKSGMFQVLGHIDAMKGFYPAFSAIETPIIEETLKVIADEQVAIEVNTSGKTKDCGGWYPSP